MRSKYICIYTTAIAMAPSSLEALANIISGAAVRDKRGSGGRDSAGLQRDNADTSVFALRFFATSLLVIFALVFCVWGLGFRVYGVRFRWTREEFSWAVLPFDQLVLFALVCVGFRV